MTRKRSEFAVPELRFHPLNRVLALLYRRGPHTVRCPPMAINSLGALWNTAFQGGTKSVAGVLVAFSKENKRKVGLAARDPYINAGVMLIDIQTWCGAGQDIHAVVCSMTNEPLRPRQKLAIKHTARTVRAMAKDIQYRMDVNTLHRDEDTKELGFKRDRPRPAAHHRAAAVQPVLEEPHHRLLHPPRRGHGRHHRCQRDQQRKVSPIRRESETSDPFSMLQKTKPIVTISPAELLARSRELYARALADGYQPDVVVGIATGGAHVVDAMGLPSSISVQTCHLSRPGTASKKSTTSNRVLRRLPTPVANALRRMEDLWLERKPLSPATPTPALLEQLDAISARLDDSTAPRVLVVDDAVDSGATLACVRQELAARLPSDHELRTAVLTITRSENRRYITPDYSLFEQTLLRFPWSNDYKHS